MISILLAQHAVQTWGIVQWLIAIIVIAGMIGVVYVVTRAMGVPIPPWIVTILWIILAVVVGVVAIRFLATML